MANFQGRAHKLRGGGFRLTDKSEILIDGYFRGLLFMRSALPDERICTGACPTGRLRPLNSRIAIWGQGVPTPRF